MPHEACGWCPPVSAASLSSGAKLGHVGQAALLNLTQHSCGDIGRGHLKLFGAAHI